MKQILLVAKETYLRQVKSWAFLFMVLSPFLFFGISAGVGYLTSKMANEDSDKLAIVSSIPTAKQAFSGVEDVTFKYRDEKAVKKAYKDEKIEQYLLIKVVDAQVVGTYVGETNLTNPTAKAQIEQALANLQTQVNLSEAKLSSEQQASLARQPLLKEEVSSKSDSALEVVKRLLPMTISFILYFMIMMYSATTAQEIATEKGTKIMEIIFSSIPAKHYFYGRILGIFGAVLTHILTYVVGGLGAYHLAYHLPFTHKFLKGVTPILQALFKNLDVILIFFLLFGILLFVVISALCGSLVNRPEDAPKASTPVIYLVIFAFIGGITLGQSGHDNLLLQVGSYFPVTSPFFMPIRYVNGAVNMVESLLSLAILFGTTAILTYFIGKSYAGFILQKEDIGFLNTLKKGVMRK